MTRPDHTSEGHPHPAPVQALTPALGGLVVLSGPSGVGKTTLVDRLLARPGFKLCRSISATTRGPRQGEADGADYYFMTRPQFEAARDRGEFLEWAEVHGHFYGTPAQPVAQLRRQGYWVLLVIDVQGGLQVRQHAPDALLVWIQPPSFESLEARLRARSTDDEAAIERRLNNARRELEIAAQHYPAEYYVSNEDRKEEEAVDSLIGLLKLHGLEGGTSDD